MNIDQRGLQDGSSVEGNRNDSPTYGIHNRTVGSSTSTRSAISCCEKNNPPSSMVDDIDEEGKSSDLQNEYDGIQNVKTTSSAMKKVLSYSAKKASIVVAPNKVHRVDGKPIRDKYSRFL